MIEFFALPEWTCDRTVIGVPVEFKPMFSTFAGQVREFSFVRRNLYPGFEFHAENLREEVDCAVEVSYAYATIAESKFQPGSSS
jgi:hypothetical protein